MAEAETERGGVLAQAGGKALYEVFVEAQKIGELAKTLSNYGLAAFHPALSRHLIAQVDDVGPMDLLLNFNLAVTDDKPVSLMPYDSLYVTLPIGGFIKGVYDGAKNYYANVIQNVENETAKNIEKYGKVLEKILPEKEGGKPREGEKKPRKEKLKIPEKFMGPELLHYIYYLAARDVCNLPDSHSDYVEKGMPYSEYAFVPRGVSSGKSQKDKVNIYGEIDVGKFSEPYKAYLAIMSIFSEIFDNYLKHNEKLAEESHKTFKEVIEKILPRNFQWEKGDKRKYPS